MRAWFECIGGASGNMMLGALFDAGAPPDAVREMLAAMPLPDWRFEITTVQKAGLGGVHVDVVTPHEHAHRHLSDIVALLEHVPEPVRSNARRVFERLAKAEAHVHRVSVEEIHFHEVGAVDAIIDVVGTCAALHLLGVDQVRCSPLPVGHGQIRCAHGLLPNPPPATVELTRGVPVRPMDVESELVTPTAAAILTALATEFTAMPPDGWDRVGYGAGTRDLPFPNLLRVLISAERPGAWLQQETLVVLETNIDDASPQIYEPLIDTALSLGARDVTLTPILMKKSRPAVQLAVLVPPSLRDRMLELLLRETTTLGVRVLPVERWSVPRRMVEVTLYDTPVRVKVAMDAQGEPFKLIPEYEDCRAAAQRSGRPLLTLLEEARAAARHTLEKSHGAQVQTG